MNKSNVIGLLRQADQVLAKMDREILSPEADGESREYKALKIEEQIAAAQLEAYQKTNKAVLDEIHKVGFSAAELGDVLESSAGKELGDSEIVGQARRLQEVIAKIDEKFKYRTKLSRAGHTIKTFSGMVKDVAEQIIALAA